MQLHLGDLVLAVAGAVLPGLVDVQQRAVGRGHADQVAGVVEQVAIALLALPQRRSARLRSLTSRAFSTMPRMVASVSRLVPTASSQTGDPSARRRLNSTGPATLGLPLPFWSSPRDLAPSSAGPDTPAGWYPPGRRRVPHDPLGGVAGVENGAVGRQDRDQIG